MSGRAMLDDLRAQGVSIADHQLYDLVATIERAQANAGAYYDVPYGAQIDTSLVSEWRAGRPGSYAYSLDVVFRDTAAGVDQVEPRMVTSDRPLTPAEAVEAWYNSYEEGEVLDPASYTDRVRGAYLVNSYAMTGRRP